MCEKVIPHALRGDPPDNVAACVVSFSAAISACENGVQWEQALSLLHKMRAAGTTANVVSHSAATAGCDEGDQCQQALTVFPKMRDGGAHVISLGSATAVCPNGAMCEKGGQGAQTSAPNVVSHSAAISSCERCMP